MRLKFQRSSPCLGLRFRVCSQNRMLSFWLLIQDLKGCHLRRVSWIPVHHPLQRQSKLLKALCVNGAHLRINRLSVPNQSSRPTRINSRCYLRPRPLEIKTLRSAENPSSPRLKPPPVLTSDAPLNEVDAPRDDIGAVLIDFTEVAEGEVEPSFIYRTRSTHSTFPATRTFEKRKCLQMNLPNLFLV
jgi:hypothetical protein